MSKIVLSSCDFRNDESAKQIYDNLPYPIHQCRVLYFPSEKATKESINSNKYNHRLCEFGFRKENIYIFNYFSPSDFDTSSVIDVIYISGGNTFGTLKRIRESGADKLILDYVARGAMYIGGSAGAHIASRSIEHVAKYDVETFGLTNYSGLNLFHGIILCHYSELRENDYFALVEKGEQTIVKLSDSDSIILEV